MVNASTIHSVFWLALAACYEGPPDIELHVYRGQAGENISFRVCDEAKENCKCNRPPGGTTDTLVFQTGEDTLLKRDFALHIDDDYPRVTIALVFPGGGQGCHLVELTDQPVVRYLDLRLETLNANEPAWRCGEDMTWPCDMPQNCQTECSL